MPGKDKTNHHHLPLHEALPNLIDSSVHKGDFSGFQHLLRIVEKIDIPKNHGEILEAIREGKTLLCTILEEMVLSVEIKLEQEIGKIGMAEDNQESLADFPEETTEAGNTPAQRIIAATTLGPASSDKSEDIDGAKLHGTTPKNLVEEDPHRYYPTKHP